MAARRIPFRVIVGPLPPATVARRADGLAWLAMIMVTAADGEQLVTDLDAAPTVAGAQAKGEGLAARWAGGLEPAAAADARDFLDKHGWPPED
jgi:hypothetical protein